MQHPRYIWGLLSVSSRLLFMVFTPCPATPREAPKSGGNLRPLLVHMTFTPWELHKTTRTNTIYKYGIQTYIQILQSNTLIFTCYLPVTYLLHTPLQSRPNLLREQSAHLDGRRPSPSLLYTLWSSTILAELYL